MSEARVRHGQPEPRYAQSPDPSRRAAHNHEQPAARTTRPERLVLRERDRESRTRDDSPLPVFADGHLFRTLMDTSGDSLGGQTGGACGSMQAWVTGFGDVEAFVEQLSPRLQATQNDVLDAVLHLPQLGRINVSARRRVGQSWDIDLELESAAAHARLQNRASDCEEALSASLQRPVSLRIRRVDSVE